MDTYQVEVRVRFRAGHRLIEPYKGPCNNPHGEGYTAICIFETDKLDECGMLVDFGKVKKKIKTWIDYNWDHSYICHSKDYIGEYLKQKGFRVFEMSSNPTAENIAKLLYGIIKKFGLPIKKVGIIESFEDSIGWYEDANL